MTQAALLPLMTMREVADYLQVSPCTVRRLVEKQGLPAVRAGRQLRFRREDVDGWLGARAAAGDGRKAGRPATG